MNREGGLGVTMNEVGESKGLRLKQKSSSLSSFISKSHLFTLLSQIQRQTLHHYFLNNHFITFIFKYCRH